MQTAEKYAELFSTMGVLSHAGVAAYRTKTIRAGRMLETECFPIYSARSAYERLKEQKRKVAPETMRKANERNSEKRMRRLAHANFGEGDYWATLTYEDGESVTREQAMKDMRNFIARIQRARIRAGLKKTKYIYVVEWGETNGRIHHHIIMERMDWDTVHKLWEKGRTEVQKIQESATTGMEECVKYMLKRTRPNPQGERRKEKTWVASKGMKQPAVLSSDRKVSRRKVEKIARAMEGDEQEARAIFEKAYPGYKLAKVSVKLCEWAPGAYIYATMYKDKEKAYVERRRR